MSERLTDEQLRVMRSWHARRGVDDPIHARVVDVIDEALALRAERVKLGGAVRKYMEAVDMTADGLSTDNSHYVRVNEAEEALQDLLAQPAESGATEPKKKWAETFSAEDVLLAAYFPDSGAKP